MPGTAPNFTSNPGDPTPTNDSAHGYNTGDLWLNSNTLTFFQLRDSTPTAAKWVLYESGVNAKSYGALGNGMADDTLALYNACVAATTTPTNYPQGIGIVRVPAGVYLISDTASGLTTQNSQGIIITGANQATFKLDVTLGTAGSTGTTTTTTTPTAATYTAGNTALTANSIAASLQSVPGIGAANVTVTYDTTNNWYAVVFAHGMGAPVIKLTPNSVTPANSGMALSIKMITSGAGLFLQHFNSLILVGEGPGGLISSSYPAASRTVIRWNGTANGIMLDFHGCLGVGTENIAFYGNNGSNYARVGVMFSSDNFQVNGNARYGGSGLTCRSCGWAQIGINAPFQDLAACVMFGMNFDDLNASEGKFYNCGMGNVGLPPVGNGIVLRNSQSVDHDLFGVDMGGLAVGFWAQSGGNMVWSGGSLEAVGTVLKLGIELGGVPGYFAYFGGGFNASTFLLQNLRTEAPTNFGFSPPAPPFVRANTILVDASYPSAGAHVIIDGWDDAATDLDASASEPALVIGAGVHVLMRSSVFQRGLPSSLAQEATGSVLGVSLSNSGSGYTGTGSPPQFPVTFSGGGLAAAQQAQGYATVANGQVTSVVVTNPSSGYSSPPTVDFSQGGGTLATAVVYISGLNVPSTTIGAVLRLDNVTVYDGLLLPFLCQRLGTSTKLDIVNERTAYHQIVRPDASTILGRPRYSPLSNAIRGQNPQNLFELGEIGLIAVNSGGNSFLAADQFRRNDGQYLTTAAAGSAPWVQNQQGLILTDAIGAFNTLKVGYVSLRNPSNSGINLGPATLPWWLYVRVKRNSVGNYHSIVSHLGQFAAGGGGFELRFDDVNYTNKLVFLLDNGTTRTSLVGMTSWPAGSVLDILAQIVGSTVNVYAFSGGQQSTEISASFPGYADNLVVPLIGATRAVQGVTLSVADLQIGRLANGLSAIPVSLLAQWYSLGSQFNGR